MTGRQKTVWSLSITGSLPFHIPSFSSPDGASCELPERADSVAAFPRRSEQSWTWGMSHRFNGQHDPGDRLRSCSVQSEFHHFWS